MIAIVLDANLQSALATVRSLGQKGIKVICGAERKTAMSFFSKYCVDSFVYTSPKKDQNKFFQDILRKIEEQQERPVLFAFSDAVFLPLARNQSKLLEKSNIALANVDSIEIAFNKKATMRLAQKLSVPIPQTYFYETIEDFKKNIIDVFKGRMIIKPVHSCAWFKNKVHSATAKIVSSQEEAIEIFSELLHGQGEAPLLQEFVEGEEYGAFFLYEHGRLISEFAHKRLRSISPLGGASCLRQSIEMPEDIRNYSIKLLDALNWHGVAMVEFKRDVNNSNIPKLMEINGRFWGSLPLAVFSGRDFPWLYYKLSNGEIPDKESDYKVGIKARHLLADAKNLLTVLFNNKFSWLNKQQTLIKFCNFFSRDLFYDVESWKDPKPFFAEIIDSIFRKL